MVRVEDLRVDVCRVPTGQPESDGTLCWEHTTLVVVRLRAGCRQGLGYTYAHPAAARLVEDMLKPLVVGQDAFAIEAAQRRMAQALRNVGRPGIGMDAVSAVDVAMWDLKARLLDLPLVDLLGAVREDVALYGSGGFTNTTKEKLAEKLGEWARAGFSMIKMKVGTWPDEDLPRVRLVRQAVGEAVGLFVDANGAYSRKQALAMAEGFAGLGVGWFEEPVSSDDLDGLRLIRDRLPAGMNLAAGEYGHGPAYFRAMLAAGAVDVLQADATRCGGITGYLKAAALAEAHQVPLSAHMAPALHLHVGCATQPTAHLEWFADHVRVEYLLFDGTQEPRKGRLAPDRSRPGLGLEFKEQDAARFAVT